MAKAAVPSKGVVLLLMISTPIVGSCYCSMFLCVTLFTSLLTQSLTGDSASKTLSSVGKNQCSSWCSVGNYTVKPLQPGR